MHSMAWKGLPLALQYSEAMFSRTQEVAFWNNKEQSIIFQKKCSGV